MTGLEAGLLNLDTEASARYVDVRPTMKNTWLRALEAHLFGGTGILQIAKQILRRLEMVNTAGNASSLVISPKTVQ